MNCISEGSFKLAGKDPAVMPVIDFQHLTAEDDMLRMVECFKLARKMVGTAPLKDFFHMNFILENRYRLMQKSERHC